MALAYLFADGDGPEPRELDALRAIRTFGAQAVWGRPVGVGEIRRMTFAERIVGAYRSRDKHPDGWAAWAAANPILNRLLNAAMLAAGVDDGE
jgi:hypothetical protein